MILSYIRLVGSTSAKDIFNQCMGTYLKAEGESTDPIELRSKITHIIQSELDGLQADGMIERATNSLGQVFYRVKA